jgi:hypothetical protein
MYFFMRQIISTPELEHKYQILCAGFAQFARSFSPARETVCPGESLAAARPLQPDVSESNT